jgi:hypothetical protein
VDAPVLGTARRHTPTEGVQAPQENASRVLENLMAEQNERLLVRNLAFAVAVKSSIRDLEVLLARLKDVFVA